MPPIDAHSGSEILRASAVLLIFLRDVAFGPWTREQVGDLMVRQVTMQVIIEEILKGKVLQNKGKPFGLNVQQRGTGGFRVMDYYGLWSHVTLANGVKLLAFCPGTSEDATVLLTDGNCERLVDPEGALEDTKAALELETQDLSVAELIARARVVADKRGDIFARYVLAKMKARTMPLAEAIQPPATPAKEASMARPIPTDSDFELIIQLIEDPKTTARARATYLLSVYEELGLMASPPRQREIRLIRAMLELLTVPEAKSLHDAIGSVYLPNMLGLARHPPNYSADEVFKDRASERQIILSSLERESKKEFAPRLIQWFARLGTH
jgi:hypothetical protein